MEGASVHAVLARADGAASLPRLGGMARPDGVVIVSERFWAFAALDGSVRRGTMPVARRALRRVPLLRGLAKLAASLSPLVRGGGVASVRERAFLVAVALAPVPLAFAPHRIGLAAGVVLTAALVCWLLRGRTLHLHGAEHRAVMAAEERRLTATWAGTARPSRFAPRCGTNFAALVLPVTFAADRFWVLPTAVFTPVAVTLLSLALTMELWQVVQASRFRALRLLLVPGLALQRLTTRDPALDETRLALVAVASVLERELAQPV